MLLGTLDTTLLKSLLTGKGAIRASKNFEFRPIFYLFFLNLLINFKVLKEQDASRLLSSLEMKTPLSEFPLVGPLLF